MGPGGKKNLKSYADAERERKNFFLNVGEQLPEIVPPPLQRSRQGDRRLLANASRFRIGGKSKNTRIILSSGSSNVFLVLNII